MANQTRITELSSLIARETEKINDFFAAQGLPAPSFDEDAPISLPIPDDAKDIVTARILVIEACNELKALLKGPKELLAFNWTELTSLKIILSFNLDKSFPIGSQTTFDAMAETSGLEVSTVRRVVRHGIYTYNLFKEPTPGIITHSSLTAALAKNELLRAYSFTAAHEFLPAGAMAANAMKKWPNSEENSETGYALVHGGSMYDIFAAHPERGDLFGKAMAMSSDAKQSHTMLLLEKYPWSSNKIMVDVGGSHGSVSIKVAERFPHMKCVVQDRPQVIEQGEQYLPEQLKGRVEFMAHDFFTEQPIVADVYYFRWIFHNWSDKYCIKILQNLIPSLRPGARIVIHERILPDDLSKVRSDEARGMVYMDIGMLQLLNARERELNEWRELLSRADSRFVLEGSWLSEGGSLSIIEGRWLG